MCVHRCKMVFHIAWEFYWMSVVFSLINPILSVHRDMRFRDRLY